jgi:hypothetical protein
MKIKITLVVFFVLTHLTLARIVNVSTTTAFKTAVTTNLLPGDTVILANGSYNLNSYVSITKSGTIEQPILIKAQSVLGVTFTGTSFFVLKRVAYITLEGFVFQSTNGTAVKMESCNNCRVTRNVFRLNETNSLKWVYIGGTYNLTYPESHHNRIDHNLFENKSQPGNMITIDGSPEPNCLSSQYDRIDHNHFRNVGPRITNGMETIRIGWSAMSMSSGFTTVEYNLFENCDGDPEIISVKTCDNKIRYNTFKNCQGTVCLRHGNRSIIEANHFIGYGKSGVGGVRIYGDDHIVFNNYFCGLTGTNNDAAITVTNGDADSGNTDLTKHFRPRRGIYAFNTLFNNSYNIEIGYTSNGNYTKPPKDNTFANNIVYGNKNQLVKIFTTPLSHVWSTNIMYPAQTATLGILALPSEIKVINPQLVYEDSLWRLSPASPARDSAQGCFNFLMYDIDGQIRVDARDIGCDEYSSEPLVMKLLQPDDVGPLGGNILVAVELINFTAEVEEQNVLLKWITTYESNVRLYEVYRNEVLLGRVNSKGSSTSKSNYNYIDKQVPSGQYEYKLIEVDFNGKRNNIATTSVVIELTENFNLYQNYPNPFNPSTNISFELKTEEHVTLRVYDLLGNLVATLVDENRKAGSHIILFPIKNIEVEKKQYQSQFTSGVYFYQLKIGTKATTKKMILTK